MSTESPIALFIFNRPDLTEIVFQRIAEVKPKILLVIADGPRFSEEVAKCQAARAVIDKVDWDCQLISDFSEKNLGCKARVASGLNWVFSKVDRAIVIEDDALLHRTFFHFCDELLDCYAHDERIMHIGGLNLVPEHRSTVSFRFSRLFPSAGGWATWRRAWQKYDIDMKLWPEYRNSDDLLYFGDQKAYVYRSFERVYSEHIDTWDTQWAYSCTINGGFSIIPKTNLLQNLGFRADATHTVEDSWIASIPVKGLDFPLRKPLDVQPNRELDQRYLAYLSGSASFDRGLYGRMASKARRALRRFGLE